MYRFKQLFCITLCLIIVLISLNVTVLADDSEIKYPKLSITSHTAVPLDKITVAVNMDENPGIMAMTFCIAYDTSVFTFVEATNGTYPDSVIVDHADKGYISYVACGKGNHRFLGALLTIQFEIKTKAAPGKYNLKIININPGRNGDSLSGCFADWNRTTIIPIVTQGVVTVGESCNNMGHTFGEWETTVKSTCTVEGVKTRSCTKCGHTETETVPISDHDFENFFTVDRKASDGISGIMSRHCKNCSAVTDKTYFSLSDSDKNDIPNRVDETVNEKDVKDFAEKNSKSKKDNTSTTNGKKNAAENTGTSVDDKTKTDKKSTKEIIKESADNVNSADELIETVKESDNQGVLSIILSRFFSPNGILRTIKRSLEDAFRTVISSKPFVSVILMFVSFISF